MGESSTQYELWSSSTELHTQTVLKGSIVNEVQQIREIIKNLPKDITFPQSPSITAKDNMVAKRKKLLTGDIAEQYFPQFATTSGTDNTFGLEDRNDKFLLKIKRLE